MISLLDAGVTPLHDFIKDIRPRRMCVIFEMHKHKEVMLPSCIAGYSRGISYEVVLNEKIKSLPHFK